VKIVYHPAAAAEQLDHIHHYATLNPALGAGYLEEFRAALFYIAESTQRFPVVAEPQIRRHFLSRFPIAIYFRAVGEQVQIIAVAHKRRRPHYWTSRL
jgi:plasmid stabilization system protein ParE